MKLHLLLLPIRQELRSEDLTTHDDTYHFNSLNKHTILLQTLTFQNQGLRLSGKQGLNHGENVIDSVWASMLVGASIEYGITNEDWLKGELVITQDKVVFLESTGIFKTGKRRHHAFPLVNISGVRIESRGITGALSGEVFIAFDYRVPEGTRTERYSCYKGDAERIHNRINTHLESSEAFHKFRNELVRLIKPKGEANLVEIATMPSILQTVSKMKKMPVSMLAKPKIDELVRDAVHSLISEGLLDGIVDDDGKYSSSLMLSRKTVQYQVSIDFTSLFSQLKNKGIILETVECPSCKGKLEYPNSGSIITCKYCGSTVTAVDILERFKGLLDI